jgi:hypothetical protein
MSKVEDSGDIPKSGQERPNNEATQAGARVGDDLQTVEDESVMSLEIALVRALQQLGQPPE